ncbi:MAG TPA: alpha/beta hydrolase [Kofleriaceae bacterium]|jgi:pimeloyl-ACP methyl ester carboxylesterase|nr:alpha/beta hydrolase [Kofleriaceae bacterium]
MRERFLPFALPDMDEAEVHAVAEVANPPPLRHDLHIAVRLAFVFACVLLPSIAPSFAQARPRWERLPLPPRLPEPADHGSVDVDGARIAYSIFGKGEPVLLLHGGLGNSGHFGFQLPALVDKFQVIAIDSRGQGRSTRTKVTITYDLMAADVIAVLDHLNIERASVVGWSDGGEVALKLGIKFPERVNRLFVFGANYDATGSKARGNRSATFAGYTQKCRADYQRVYKTVKGFDALVEALLPLWRNPTGITPDQLRAIKAPVAMADGDHDELIVIDQIVEMARLIPHGKLVIFHDTSHFALWQDPEAFNQAMLGFLTEPITADHPP